ncbi:FAD-dependent oxidoreductase [Acetobacter oeni]|uniref:Pyridine nucleotide-disulfide oxidoreductase n=1 Tax=Acetobacter oeni TaxID=304077 RepID=A0A511XGM0_9PROT|nr:FAD-dependent oxidoreductase [Acetobacter oeni]MBB3881733.1 NADPH-dependent 2,4-dienoyl-CoA reductase/sulfur reductase-like enzyme/nitrite reductase/ring-hydroxylating ferredoxin subunit [Acetobacter oeni]NHO17463.1 Rieske 2Fe-2S domain-containing protein [Acetobacter oeni]GBR01876.1 rubredoxin-NAD reductase [Acetobacter oeni LMG 21952]GEN62095.1 pyridine nucleotide-disulfide oxidoreductase [Acetobacter oeni]
MTDPAKAATEWHGVMPDAELSSDTPARVMVGEKPILLIRTSQEHVRAFSAECPHKGAPLEKSAVCNGRIACPWHKAEFSLHDGSLIEPLALDPLPQYPVKIQESEIFIGADPLPVRPAPSSHENERVIIVGGGAAGTAAAVSLREFGFNGSVTIVDEDTTSPYDRPALSKTVLAGKTKTGKPPALRPEDYWRAHRIERVSGTAKSMEPGSKKLTLTDGRTMEADHLLLSPGSVAKRPDIPGASLDGVFTLRHEKDAEAIMARIENGSGRVVVCGGSFIAMEAAAALRMRGLDVTVIAPSDVPFAQIFGEEAARRLMKLHVEKGVTLLTGRRVRAVTGQGQADGVTLDDGTHVPADLVIMGVGVIPATEFTGALREKDGGINVDDHMLAAPGIYVAGDAARFPHNGGRTRIEHWRTAEVQGRQVARSIMKQPQVFDQLPWFWTQQFDAKLEYAGYQEEFDHAAFEGDAEKFDFTVTLTKAGRWVGTVTAGRPKVTGELVLKGPPGKPA